MSDIDALEAFAADLIARLEPAACRELARRIAGELRQRNQKRIAAQTHVDGSPYAPRKPQLRHKVGTLRRQMFSRLRTARFLKASGSTDGALVEFTEQVSRIARVHHFGLRDRVNRRNTLEADYPARQLIGIADEDEALIRELVTAHLADRL